MDRVLIVVPTYSQFDYAARAVASAFQQTRSVRPMVLLVDDYSPDWEQPLPAPLRKLAGRYGDDFLVHHFNDHGGLTRSWNYGLEAARRLDCLYACPTNSDVIFSPGWDTPLVASLNRGYALAGPVTNAPGPTARGKQDVTRYLLNYRPADDAQRIAMTASALAKRFRARLIESPLNGFCVFGRTKTWWDHAYEGEYAYRPINLRYSTGMRNVTPLMTGNEDELQSRWNKAGLKTVVAPASFVFHYRAVSRGDKYRRRSFYRAQEQAS